MRYVHLNRPFVIRGAANGWPAFKKWDVEFLKSEMNDSLVNVACTPLGNADSVVKLEDGNSAFVKPHEALQPFREATDFIQEQELHGFKEKGWIQYLQTQNDNLRGEYDRIFSDVPHDIPFARIALQKAPDAINFWLGNSHSTTALHKDNYENIYAQILGQKHFVLLPPVEAPCVNEQYLPAATYKPAPGQPHELSLDFDRPTDGHGTSPSVPFAMWDPDKPQERTTSLSQFSSPMRVSLKPGDVLYLPAQWYHKVKQSCSSEGICVAVNYWYDMEFAGSFNVLTSFVRNMANSLQRDREL